MHGSGSWSLTMTIRVGADDMLGIRKTNGV